MKTLKDLYAAIEAEKTRSAWDKGKKAYALELAEQMAENNGLGMEFHGSPADKKELLSGASDWNQYSWGGCSFVYDADIAARPCTPSELKRNHDGDRRPNANEEWLDTQARALNQAAHMIVRIAKK